MLAHDVRIELALAEDVKAAGSAGPGEDVRRRINAAPLRPSNEPRKIVDLNRRRHGTLTQTPEGGSLLGDLAIPEGFCTLVRPHKMGRKRTLSNLSSRFCRTRIGHDELGRELVPRANLGRATPWQYQLLHEPLH